MSHCCTQIGCFTTHTASIYNGWKFRPEKSAIHRKNTGNQSWKLW
jgi:hypothetical protein